MATRQATRWSLFVLSIIINSGCGKAVDPKQVYTDAVALYNLETEALDGLEQRRQRLVDAHSETVDRLKREHVQKAAVGQIGSIAADVLGGLGKSAADAEPVTEDNVLERLDDLQGVDAESLINRAAQAGAALNNLPPDVQEQIDQSQRDLDTELAPLDEQIAKQRTRVDSATQARDAAEAAMNK